MVDAHKGLIADAALMAQNVNLLNDFHLDFTSTFDHQGSAEDRQKEREAEARERERERENRVYEDAIRARDESRWERAVERFNDVATMKGTRVDAALCLEGLRAGSAGPARRGADDHCGAGSRLSQEPLPERGPRAGSRSTPQRRPAGSTAGPGGRGSEADGYRGIAAPVTGSSDPDAGEAARRPQLAETQGARALRARAKRFATGARCPSGHRKGELDTRASEPRDQLSRHSRRA